MTLTSKSLLLKNLGKHSNLLYNASKLVVRPLVGFLVKAKGVSLQGPPRLIGIEAFLPTCVDIHKKVLTNWKL
jgi:hypothetical protein